MRAVNLIPAEQRGGAGAAAGRSEGGAYAVLGLLGGLALLALLYGSARHQISSRRSAGRRRSPPRRSRPRRRPAQLAPYTSFMALREQRVQAVSAARRLALRLGSRLPRARPRAAQRRLDHLADAARSARLRRRDRLVRAPAPAPRTSAAGAARAVDLGDAARQRPDLHAQRLRDEPGRGRADARPPAPDRRRQRSDAAELHQAGRRAVAAAARGGCPGSDPAFAMQITFDPLPAPTSRPTHRGVPRRSTSADDIDRRRTMTGRDRIVVIGIAVARRARRRVAAGRLARAQAGREARHRRSAPRARSSPTAESQVASARSAQAQYAAAYASIVSLGKAVPPERGSAVADLPARAGVQPEERRILLDHRRRGSGVERARAPRRRPRGRGAAAGFTQMPFTFVFNGSFFDLYHLFQQLERFTVRTTSGGAAGERSPAHDPERQAGAATTRLTGAGKGGSAVS